jgi:xanthine/uracil permease
MYWGIVLGASFVAVMGLIAGADTVGKYLILVGSVILAGVFTALAEYVVIRAKRTRRY